MLKISYEITPLPLAHRFAVKCTVPAVKETLKISMAAWVPGSYLIRDFARNIIGLKCFSAQSELALLQLDKQTWEVNTNGELTIAYEVHSVDPSVRGAFVDDSYGLFDGCQLFLILSGYEDCATEILLKSVEKLDWTCATSLEKVEVDEQGFGLYQAKDYYDLIDHPVLMGELKLIDFSIHDIPHRIAVRDIHSNDYQQTAEQVAEICKVHHQMFGEPRPINNYTFLLNVTQNSYGGLEHCFSSNLVIPRKMTQPHHKNYKQFLALFSHEYFHLWNVKRIKPKAFSRPSLMQEVYTRTMWIWEGITSYYDELALVRSQQITVVEYLEMLGENISRLYRNQGRKIQSLAASSLEAWNKLYKSDEHSINMMISYYTKGAFVACLLDLKIRNETAGQKSLDDVMRYVWQQHGSKDNPLDEQAFEKICEAVSGLELKAFFDKAIRSTEDLDYHELFNLFAISCEYKINEDEIGTEDVSLGLKVNYKEKLVYVHQVFKGQAAADAGLMPKDELIALNQIRITANNIKDLLAGFQVNDTVELIYCRDDEIKSTCINLGPAEKLKVELSMLNNSTSEAQKAQADWLWQTKL